MRTSWKQGAFPVSKVANIIETPFRVSFSVANGNGCFFPFQSKLEASKDSVKSAFGSQSVHILCPWKPPTIPFLPNASSCHPISSNFGLPCNISFTIKVNFVINSQSLSAGITLDFVITSGKFFPAFLSNPSLQFSFIQ